jgi:hypothetical protein
MQFLHVYFNNMKVASFERDSIENFIYEVKMKTQEQH